MPLGIVVDLDALARLFNANFIGKDGKPGTIVGIRGQADQANMREIKAKLSSGGLGAGEIAVIDGIGNITVQDMSATPRDIQWVESLQMGKSDIMDGFGVPESVMGNSSGKCVDDQTEALTQRGWVSGLELTTDDTNLLMDLVDGQLKWSPVPNADRIERCAKEAGAAYSIGETDERKVFVNGRGEIAAAVVAVSPGKVLSIEFLLALTQHQRELVLQTMVDADGCRQKNIVDVCRTAGR